jgi:hypothetical protein
LLMIFTGKFVLPSRREHIKSKNFCNRYEINKCVNKYESESPSPRF